MANNQKTDLEQGTRDTAGRPVIKSGDEETRQEEEEKSDEPKDPE